jgi:sarcosine dehydrogenase
VQSDLTVNCLTPERFYLVTPGASSQHDWDWIRREVSRKGFNVQMQDVTRDWAVLSVQGPKSRRLLEAMFERVGGGTSLSDGDFPFATHQEVPFGSEGVHIRMLRLTFAGELGWELHIPKVHASDVYDAVFSAGAEFGVKNGGYGALESLSLEKGYRHWHVDVRMDDTPLEAGMTWVCKLKTNTPFLGREALEAQRAAGLKKRLCYVKPQEDVPIFGLEALLRNGEPVGYLRRAGYAFSLKTPLGIAYVHAPEELAKVTPEWIKREDVKWELEVMGRRVPVTVSLGTPFDPKNLRVKGQYE